MDQTTPPVRQTHTQVQIASRIQPPSTINPSEKTLDNSNAIQQISGSKEHSPIRTSVPAETAQFTEESSPQPSAQEAGNMHAPAVKEEQQVEITSAVPEIAVEKSVESVIEKSVDTEKPEIPEELKKVGVTHSGPGIPIETNKFAVTTMPMKFEEAKVMDKASSIKDSKHWLAELVMYVWRKIDPNIEKKAKEVKK